MGDRTPRTLVLELDSEDPPRGVLRPLEGPSIPFRGWLGLAGAIEAGLRDHGDLGPENGSRS